MEIHSRQDDKGCLLFTYTCVSILFDLSMQPSDNVSIEPTELYYLTCKGELILNGWVRK